MITEETRKKMSDAAKRRCTPEWRKAKSDGYRTMIDDGLLVASYTGGMTQEECAELLRVSRRVIERAMTRLGIKSRVAAKRDQWGDKNSSWKGDKANLTCKHRRLYRAFGQPSKCDFCETEDKSKTYDWANLTGDYDNPHDYMRLCRSCHRKYDNERRRTECHG